MRITTTCGILTCLPLAVVAAGAQQLIVDCDAGDDLAQALEQAVSSGLTWIAVEGTCEGNFELQSPVSMTIEGHDATLVSPDENIVFRIGGPGSVSVRGFEIHSGSTGVKAVGEDARVNVRQCQVHDNGWGVEAGEGAQLSVTLSEIHHNDLGLYCDDESSCSASFATIRDNRFGVRVEGRSDLQSFGTEISANTESGVFLGERSTGNFDQSTFFENGAFHLALIDRSHALLQNGTALGGPGDGTPLALATGLLASAETSPFGATVKLHGDVLATDSSYLVLDGARVSGDLEIVDFAEVKLVRTAVAGRVLCQSGGDAVCGAGSFARVKGCASARPSCSPDPSDRPLRHGAVFDGADRFEAKDAAEPESPVPSGASADRPLR